MPYPRPVMPRSAGSIPGRRVPQDWPRDRDFRILAIDGGGIRGLFSAGVLAELEAMVGPVNSVAEYFDLVAGTSTGGIVALGLGAGKSARDIRDLYMHRGPEIFPPVWDNVLGRSWKAFRNNVLNATFHRYSRQALERVLQEFLGDKILGESTVRHVVPAFDGRFSEVFLFKTRHHADYEQDWRKRMVEIGLATSAAPTIYRPLESGGYRLIDGGIWANNPTMLAVVEALIAYDVARHRIKVLSIGCGDEPYHVTRRMTWGGLWHWRKIIGAAMRAQSLAATSQARLLLGPSNVIRIDPTLVGPPIELDDYRRAMDELLPAVTASVAAHRDRVRQIFFTEKAAPFIPVP
jgi:patatin-like phospholipase/acyl hydrolase